MGAHHWLEGEVVLLPARPPFTPPRRGPRVFHYNLIRVEIWGLPLRICWPRWRCGYSFLVWFAGEDLSFPKSLSCWAAPFWVLLLKLCLRPLAFPGCWFLSKSGIYEAKRKLKELTSVSFLGSQGPSQSAFLPLPFGVFDIYVYLPGFLAALSGKNWGKYVHSIFYSQKQRLHSQHLRGCRWPWCML